MFICKENLCVGCGVCTDACPCNCITLNYDSNGFLKSNVDSTNCVNCKKCIAVCPSNNPNNTNEIFKAYKVRRNDFSSIMESSSGGVAALISEMAFKNGAYVIGCSFDNELVLRHMVAENLEQLEKFKGSKYIQSLPVGIYKQIKQLLDEGESVLFTGTPCQVSALNNYLEKPYDNLKTIDFICYGVSSRKILNKYLEKNKEVNNRIINVKFRSKKDGYRQHKSYDITMIYENGEKVLDSSHGFALWFKSKISINECCYNCDFSSSKRTSDITLADYAGKDIDETDLKYGTSMVFVNTKKGEKMLNEILDEVCYEEKDKTDCILRYPRLKPMNQKISKKRKAFFRDLDKLNLEQMESKYTLKKILPSKLSLYINAIMKRIKKRNP